MDKYEAQKNFLQSIKREFRGYGNQLKGKKVVLYGAGTYGRTMLRMLDDICGIKNEIIAICDSNSLKWGGSIEGIEIRSIKNVIDKEQEFTVVITSEFNLEIAKLLEEYHLNIFSRPDYGEFVEKMLMMYIYKTSSLGIANPYKFIEEYYDNYFGKEDEIYDLLDDMESREVLEKRVLFYQTGDVKYINNIPVTPQQYFNMDCWSTVGENEVFIDCGAYTGDTIEGFMECVRGKYKAVYAFEPDSSNFKRLEKGVKHTNIYLNNAATGNENGYVFFENLDSSSCSFISDTGKTKVKLVRIEDVVDKIPTWIKMDIEGAEYESLQGCENIIKNYAPKLAICVYHKCEDLFKIPVYLKKLSPQYRLRLRQHKCNIIETVLYAEIVK